MKPPPPIPPGTLVRWCGFAEFLEVVGTHRVKGWPELFGWTTQVRYIDGQNKGKLALVFTNSLELVPPDEDPLLY